MRSIVFTIGLLALLAGCRTSPPESAIAPAESCLPDSWRPALDVPLHADPSFDPDTGLWAEAIRSGPLYPVAEGPTFPTADVRPVDDPWLPYYWASVLDSHGEPVDRVFLLCEESGHRIGFWQGAEDLRPTNRSPALLVGRPPIPESVDESTPGVRLPPGAASIEPYDASMVRATYDGYNMRAYGLISAGLVDIVFESTKTPERELVDGMIVGSTIDVFDAPDGVAFASISGGRTWARKLDTSPGFVLVRFWDGDAAVVGWIDVAAFEARPPRIVSRKGGGGGSGYGGPNTTSLELGTLLIHEASELVVGVITEAGEFWCPAPCEEPAPRIVIHACEHEFELRAVRPTTSTRLCPG